MAKFKIDMEAEKEKTTAAKNAGQKPRTPTPASADGA